MTELYSNKRATPDSVKYSKHCKDFKCLNDGTIYREAKYCELSRQCVQVDVVEGNTLPMESHYCPVVNLNTGEVQEFDYYCTGMHDARPLNERLDDEKVS